VAERRAAAPVVADPDASTTPSARSDVDIDGGGLPVPGGVGQRLGDRVVGRAPSCTSRLIWGRVVSAVVTMRAGEAVCAA
jgi:hypothetical protein